MLLPILLLACGGAESPPSGPDAAAGAAAANTMCKLIEGARQECDASGTKVTWGDRELSFSVVLDSTEEKFGQTSFSAHVTLSEKGKASYMSHAVGFGGSKQDALGKGFHEWAVISGVAILDALMDDPARPALKALDPMPQMPAGSEKIGSFDVMRGFSLVRGDQPPEDGISHEGLVKAVAPYASKLSGDKPHVLSLHRASGLSETELKCWLDGVASEELCAAFDKYEWPVGSTWELKQTYVLAP